METRIERRVMNLMNIEKGMSVKAISERLIIPHEELSAVLKNLQKQHRVKVTHNGIRVRLPIDRDKIK